MVTKKWKYIYLYNIYMTILRMKVFVLQQKNYFRIGSKNFGFGF